MASENKKLQSLDKWRFTFYTTFVLLILFNPSTYKLMNSLLSNLIGPIASQNGCPTLLGFFIHVLVFTLIIRFLMDLHI
jgi:hypothetical protein